MKKEKSLIAVYPSYSGIVHTRIFNNATGYYENRSFLYYTKKEIIAKLRADGVVVSRKMEKTDWRSQK